eukprot:685079-Amphidinium_carterae.1
MKAPGQTNEFAQPTNSQTNLASRCVSVVTPVAACAGMVGTVPGEPLSAFRTTITEDEAAMWNANAASSNALTSQALFFWKWVSLRASLDISWHSERVKYYCNSRVRAWGL